MIVDDQKTVRAFLADARTHGGAPVEIIETHISILFLAGPLAYKLKRAVRLPYADFSTPEQRLAICEREVALNRRTAPDHYLGVRRITEEPYGPAFDGTGPLIDAVVEMRRFEQTALLDALAQRGALDSAMMTRLAREIAAFHASAEVRHTGSGTENVAGVLSVNEAAFKTGEGIDAAQITRLNSAFRSALETLGTRLDTREAAGCVRLCHGDLHFRNIFLHDGRPVLFDCLEFNEALATVDVAYDLAFLLMDLRHRGLQPFANLVMNRWLDATGDAGALPLFPFFMALRAAVRAHVAATQAAEQDCPEAVVARARSYAGLAEALLDPVPPRLVAIGGLSGSGKSTVAAALAPRIGGGAGARILASDRLRKALFGVEPEIRLPPEAYASEVSRRVYDLLRVRAVADAVSGAAVVVDATFTHSEERSALRNAAAAAGLPFTGIWLDLPADSLRARVAARRGGPSDATPDVLERQLTQGPGPVDWLRIDAGPAGDAVATRIAEHLEVGQRPDFLEG